MKRILLVLLLGFLLLLNWADKASAVSEAGVLFLRLPAGARAAGMGETFVAVSDDATATHWNPAGLGRYPLSSEWIEYGPGSEYQIKSITLKENDLPEKNYKRYDIWAISSSDLLFWNGKEWRNYQTYSTSEGETLGSLLEKVFPGTEAERLNTLAYQMASEHNLVSRDSVERIKEMVLGVSSTVEQDSAAPEPVSVEEYQDKEKLPELFDAFLQAWDSCLVDQRNLTRLAQDFRPWLEDEKLTSQELDQLAILLETGITESLPAEIRIPYRIVFTDTLTCVASKEEEVWVGTKDGIFRFDGLTWTRYGTKDALFTNWITQVTVGPDGKVWIGTEVGMAQFDGRNWVFYTPSAGILDYYVVDLLVKRDGEIWVATKSDLARFTGKNWIAHEEYRVKAGDDLAKIARSFLGTESQVEIDKAVAEIKRYNSLKDEVSPDQSIRLPYRLAFKGELTALAMDQKGNIWVGTKKGIKRLEDGRWTTFGYRPYTAAEGDSVETVARKILNTEDEGRIGKFSDEISDYNKLTKRELEPGQKIYVYRNAAGSEILSISPGQGDNVLVGTEFGTLKFDGNGWSRYYHSGLERAQTKRIWQKDGEMWFATPEKIVVYAHAMREVTIMGANLLPELASDIFYGYVSYVQYLSGWGTMGGNITLINYGEMPITVDSPIPVGTFTAYEGALSLSYGTRFNQDLAVGLSGRVIFSHLSDVGAGREKGRGTGTSFALDAGFIYRTPFRRLTLGAALTNLGPNISYIDAPQSDPLPRNVGIGLAYKLFNTPYNNLTLVGELNKQLVGLKESIGIELSEAIRNVGLEYWYGTFIALRAGYIYDKEGDIRAATFGAGLQYNIFRFDFAYIPASERHVLGNTMRLSMTVRF